MSGQTTIQSSAVQRGFRAGGRGQMGAPVEKPKERQETLSRLISDCRPEKQ